MGETWKYWSKHEDTSDLHLTKITVLQQNIIFCIDLNHQDYLPSQTGVSNGRQFLPVGLCL